MESGQGGVVGFGESGPVTHYVESRRSVVDEGSHAPHSPLTTLLQGIWGISRPSTYYNPAAPLFPLLLGVNEESSAYHLYALISQLPCFPL